MPLPGSATSSAGNEDRGPLSTAIENMNPQGISGFLKEGLSIPETGKNSMKLAFGRILRKVEKNPQLEVVASEAILTVLGGIPLSQNFKLDFLENLVLSKNTLLLTGNFLLFKEFYKTLSAEEKKKLQESVNSKASGNEFDSSYALKMHYLIDDAPGTMKELQKAIEQQKSEEIEQQKIQEELEKIEKKLAENERKREEGKKNIEASKKALVEDMFTSLRNNYTILAGKEPFVREKLAALVTSLVEKETDLASHSDTDRMRLLTQSTLSTFVKEQGPDVFQMGAPPAYRPSATGATRGGRSATPFIRGSAPTTTPPSTSSNSAPPAIRAAKK